MRAMDHRRLGVVVHHLRLAARCLSTTPPKFKPKFMLVSNNEDFRVEQACLNRLQAPPKSLRVLHITGGADTTLTSLMHPSVGHIVSGDMSPAQLHLVRLKLAVATSDLSTSRAVGFLLRGEGGKQVLLDQLAKSMSEETVDFFLSDAEDEIISGVLRADNDNPFNKTIRNWFTDEKGVHLSRYHTMSEAEKDHVLSLCATDNGKTLTAAIQTVFKAAPWFLNMPPELQAHVLSMLEVLALANLRGIGTMLMSMDTGILPREEFYTDILLTGSPKTLPPWLSERGRRLLREKVAEGRFETFLGPISELKQAEGFDFMSLSNIYDFTSEDNAVVSVKEMVAGTLRANGEVLVRRATGRAPEILARAGGRRLEGEALENLDHNVMFFRNAGTVAAARFA